MARKVTRYRSKVTGKYISRAQWLRDRRTSVRARERYVKGERKPQGKSKLQQLLKRAGDKPVIVRKKYKNRKMRKPTYIEIVYVRGAIQSIKVGRNEYKDKRDFKNLKALVDAATEYDPKTEGPKKGV
jgi:hypothetical protein